ncbi:transposase [Leptospira santarosai]
MLNGILWILRTGAQWKDFPDRCPLSSSFSKMESKWNDANYYL